MPVRDHIQIQTQSFAPGILPESACTFRIVSCLRIVTGADIPLCFFCRITAAFYNDLDQPVWSRRVLLYKIIPRNRRRISATSPEVLDYTGEEYHQRFPQFYETRTQEDDDASSTSAESQGIADYTQEAHHQHFLHRHQHRTPVAQYDHEHRLVPYQFHQQSRHQAYSYLCPNPHYQIYLTPNRAAHPSNTFAPHQVPLQLDGPSSSGHWYTSFNPQERRWVNTWQCH